VPALIGVVSLLALLVWERQFAAGTGEPLELRVAGDQISYVVNGMVVHTTPRSGPTARTDGIVGVRINHLLDVQVDGFQVQQQ